MKTSKWDYWLRFNKMLSIRVAEIAALSTFVAMVLGTADVIGTRAFNRPVPATVELTTVFLVVIIFASLSYGEITKSHIRITTLYDRLGPRAKSYCDLAAHICGLVFFGLLTWQTILLAWDSWLLREESWGLIRFPIYPIKMIMALGLFWMTLQMATNIVDFIIRRGKNAA